MRNNLSPTPVRQTGESPGQILYDSNTSVPDRLSKGQPYADSIEERPVCLNVPEDNDPVNSVLVLFQDSQWRKIYLHRV